jgi:hypothetical protein
MMYELMCCDVRLPVDEEAEDGAGAGGAVNVEAATRRLLSQLARKNTIENVVPVLLALKRQLGASSPPPLCFHPFFHPSPYPSFHLALFLIVSCFFLIGAFLSVVSPALRSSSLLLLLISRRTKKAVGVSTVVETLINP